jgi:hypothetical protein
LNQKRHFSPIFWQKIFLKSYHRSLITFFAQNRQKIDAFLKNQCYDPKFAKTSSILCKKRQFLPHFLTEIFFKIKTSAPGNQEAPRVLVNEIKI